MIILLTRKMNSNSEETLAYFPFYARNLKMFNCKRKIASFNSIFAKPDDAVTLLIAHFMTIYKGALITR